MSDREITREAVIEAFESYLAQRVYINHPHPDVIRAAVEMLKEPEARLLALEEVETLPYGYVLIETDKQDSLRWLDALLFSKNANFSFDFITLEGRARLLGTEYNREWRCWTARPTDEQRKAVKWDDTGKAD